MVISRRQICWLIIIYSFCHITYPSSVSSSLSSQDIYDDLDPIFNGNPKEEGSELYLEGIKLFREKKFDEASERFKELLSRYPDSGLAPLAGILMGDSYLNKGETQPARLNDALRAYQEVRKDHPKDDIGAMSLLRIGDAYLKLGFSYEAMGSFRRIYSEFPGNRFIPVARMRIARVYLQSGKYQKALKELQIVTDTYPKSSEVVEAHFMKGYVLTQLKRFEDAGRIYQEGTARWPDYPKSNPEMLYAIGENYMSLGKYGMARDTFSILVNIYPREDLASKAMMRIADSYRLDGKIKEAIKIYKETINSFPDNKSTEGIKVILEEEEAFEAALKAAKDKRYNEAISAFNNLLSKYSKGITGGESEDAVIGLIKEYITDQYSKGGCLNASVIYKKFKARIGSKIRDAGFFILLGNCYMSLGLHNGAAEIYGEAIRAGGLKGDLLYRLGEAKFLGSNYSDTIKYLEEFISNYPKSKQLSDAYRYLGISLYKKGEYKRGGEILNRWLEAYPDNQYKTEGHIYLARSYLDEGSPEKASSAYRKILDQLQNPPPDLFFHLGDALFASNNCNEAIVVYKKGLDIEQGGERADYARYQIGVCYERTDRNILSKEIFSGLAMKSEYEIIKRLADERGKLIQTQ